MTKTVDTPPNINRDLLRWSCVKHTYQYVNGLLMYEDRGDLAFSYDYDAYGNLSCIHYRWANGSYWKFYVACNARGDVTAIYAADGTLRAKYTYDSWGNTLSITDANGNDLADLYVVDSVAANNIGNLNKIRYRGYYYDSESGLYYLQSRYYDPQVKRFVNADIYVSTGQGLTSSNMFAYCGNNPVNGSDPCGTCFHRWDFWNDCNSCKAKKAQEAALTVKYDVPLYNQGSYSLCWAFCQVMIESWDSGQKLSSRKAFNRAKEIAIKRHGKSNWNKGGMPSNLGEQRNISSIEDLYYLVRGRGPVYAYYSNGKDGDDASAHLVVVTGVDLTKGFVYTNNPWGVKGKQTFQQFKNGVARKFWQSNQGLKFEHVYLVNY